MANQPRGENLAFSWENNMNMKAMCIFSAVVAGTAAAGVVDFDFEAQAAGGVAGEMMTLNSQGVDVTFSATGLQIRDFGASFGGAGHVLSSAGDAGPITAEFSSGVNFVSFENLINGRYDSEVDMIDGWAYDAADNLVDSFSGSTADFATLTGDIWRVVYQESVPFAGFVMDNFSFRVPAPSAMALLGMGGLMASRRRR
tara:strand:- start:64978 stop:65574 length:597 start_codon:yes stop_codon:yes gene_type:complete